MNLDKLKESARKFEQNSQWRQAIDVYKKALREFEESGEGVPDPSLYNRIGDLEMKDNDSAAAMRAYEQASDLYTEQGFFNNAIALCGKILRINPSRTATYLRLSQLHARKNFVGEAKKNLVEYVQRMDAMKHHDEAVTAVKAFADQFSGNPDIRTMLLDLIRDTQSEPGREQLAKLAQQLEDTNEAAELTTTAEGVAIDDTEVEVAPQAPSTGGLVFIDVGLPGSGGVLSGDSDAEPLEGLDVGRAEVEEAWRRDSGSVDGLEFIRSVAGPNDVADGTDGLLTDEPFSESEAGLEIRDIDPIDIDAFPAVDKDLDVVVPSDDLDDEGFVVAPDDLPEVRPVGTGRPDRPSGELVFLPVGGDPPPVASPPSDGAVVSRDRGRVLLEVGDRAGAIAALEDAVRQFEETGRWSEALESAELLTQVEPDAIFRYQKRVELAYRSGDRGAMLQSYLSLADALLRGGGVEHAITVYKRVLDHDPGNSKAAAALDALARPERAPAPPTPAFVDLGTLILDEPATRDTRIRVDQGTPIEDEDQAFQEALEQFKRGIEANIDAEDFQAHYDLGIAFKEMGLLDEAIAQFQKALRSPEGRLKTSEQLGIAFFEKARFAISEAVLRRAIDSLSGGDEDKIGLIYWLGRALEGQRRNDEALRYYERALAVDIRFLDVGDRVHRITAGPA